MTTTPIRRAASDPPPTGAGALRAISIVVWAGLAANVAIALAKYMAAAASGSSAMLSEAIHSTADAGNGLSLVVGAVLSRKPADALHPFGRGQLASPTRCLRSAEWFLELACERQRPPTIGEPGRYATLAVQCHPALTSQRARAQVPRPHRQRHRLLRRQPGL